jgi:hypothetical protein
MRKYYSERIGKNENFKVLSLDDLKDFFSTIYRKFKNEGYFSENLNDHVNVNDRLILTLRKNQMWPIEEHLFEYTEDDLFDMIEFLYDHISEPIHDGFNSFKLSFDQFSGQEEFRQEINKFLIDYQDGYELTKDGEIYIKEEKGISEICRAKIPESADNNIRNKINLAIKKYYGSRSNLDERRIAIRELADILESLRQEIKTHFLSKDENDLFNIANNFCIRHLNEKQKDNYDKVIWYSWKFYLYLSTIHAVLRLIEKQT